MSLIGFHLSEDPQHADRLKRIQRYNEYLRTFYDRRPHFRFPKKAKRFSDEQYGIVLRTPKLLTTVMIDEHGLVKSNFALAELGNSRTLSCFYKVKFSKMTEAEIKTFVRDLKFIAKSYRWPREMLDIELQFLGDYR